MAKKKKKKKKYRLKIGRVILLLVILIILALGTRLFLDGKSMYDQARNAKYELGEIIDAVKAEDYDKAQERTEVVHGIIKSLREKARRTHMEPLRSDPEIRS